MYSNISQILLLLQNVAVLQQIWHYEILGGTLPMCQNTTMRVNEAWIKRYCVLCSKTYNTLHSCHNFPAGSRQAAMGARICETSLLHTILNLTIKIWRIMTILSFAMAGAALACLCCCTKVCCTKAHFFLSKYCLPVGYHVYIWQVSPQLCLEILM